ncbi:MAG: SDR family oxidoreductase [Planctomycetota bacterium]|nr:SDR family oxidoreductase [Planctomycetota bacterium]
MRVCVTGGAGFVGSHLVDRLLSDGHDVVVIDDLSTGSVENLAGAFDHIEFVEADIRDVARLDDAVAGCEVVFHQAALAAVARSVERPFDVHDVNVTGTLGVLMAARAAGVRRVVFASSSSVYGDTPTLPKITSMPTSPRSPYAAGKAAAEGYLEAFHASFGLETVALRYFNVYGPRQSPRSQYAAVIPLFIDAMRAGRAPTILGDGEQTRDFTYVADVVDANVRAATAEGAPGMVMNVGCGERISIRELARVIAHELGFTGDIHHAPARTGDVRDSLACIERTCGVLGWQPTVALHEGIRLILAHGDAPAECAPKAVAQ